MLRITMQGLDIRKSNFVLLASKQSGFIVGSLTQEGLDMSPNHIYCLFTTEIIDSLLLTLLDLILSNFANMPYKVSSMFAPTIL